jgi:hypothetical protein
VTRHPPAHAAKLAQNARWAAQLVVVGRFRRRERRQKRRRRRRRRRGRAIDERVKLREHRVGRKRRRRRRRRRRLLLVLLLRLLKPRRLGRPVDQEVQLRENRVVVYALRGLARVRACARV